MISALVTEMHVSVEYDSFHPSQHLGTFLLRCQYFPICPRQPLVNHHQHRTALNSKVPQIATFPISYGIKNEYTKWTGSENTEVGKGKTTVVANVQNTQFEHIFSFGR